MSSTLKLNKKPIEDERQVAPFTEEQLRAMLADIEAAKPVPAHAVADKSALPPAGERSEAPVQAPAKIHGSFSINGIPVFSPGVNINPSTGFPHNQVVAAPRGGMISPPPSKNFR